MPTLEQYHKYISSHAEALNLSHIAKYIGLQPSNFIRAVTNKKWANGYSAKIPSRCLPRLIEYFKQHNIKI